MAGDIPPYAWHGNLCQCLRCRTAVVGTVVERPCQIRLHVADKVVETDHSVADKRKGITATRECGVCGEGMPVSGRGRPPVYCSKRCKQAAFRRLKGQVER